MINTEKPRHKPDDDDAQVEEIVATGPQGAIVVAGIATAIVIALWVLFYLFVFIPRSGA
jgi:hypothetical protein